MQAIIAQDNSLYYTQFTPFRLTEKIEMVEVSTLTMVKMSKQTDDEEEGSAVFSKFMSTQIYVNPNR
jgi:hypothetical protein